MQNAGVTTVDVHVAGPFRHGRIGDDYLITNDLGDWLVLSRGDFRSFVEGKLDAAGALRERLRSHRFLHGEIALSDAAERLRQRLWFLDHGPSHHVLALTERASTSDEGGDMSLETADRAVDCAFMSTSPSLELTLTGGEPLANWEAVKRVIEYSQSKNRLSRKRLSHRLHSDLTLLDDDKLAWLVAKGAVVTTEVTVAMLDDAASPARTAIRRLHDAWSEAGADPETHHVTLRAVLAGPLLARAAEVADLAASLGCRTLELAAATDLRFVLGDEARAADSTTDWLAAFETVLERCLAHEQAGHPLALAPAQTFLRKILGGRDPNDPAIRAPAADGIGCLAYSWDGRVFASDAGRRLADEAEEDLFQLGELRYHGYHDMITSPAVRALVLASIPDGQPGCESCAFKPFCGLSPAANYGEQGSIHGRVRDGSTCQRHEGIQRLLFERLHRGDEETRSVFDRWSEPA